MKFDVGVRDNPEHISVLMKFVEQSFPETFGTWVTVIDWFMEHDFDDCMDMRVRIEKCHTLPVGTAAVGAECVRASPGGNAIPDHQAAA